MNTDKSSAEICVLCCRDIPIYAVGSCDHPVCYECSARMRVLCEQNECPICRGEMAFVIFTHKKHPFTSVHNFPLLDKRFMIAFEDERVREAFEELLRHTCKCCGESFDTFKKLEIHVRRQHNMQFCELCVESLKIFTFERKVYSRKDLAHHKRHGDTDDTSHRGHPLCEFCQTRFVDHDERFRHLRREHFFCHFCDADGLHQYYSEYAYLKDHFRKDHFLCEEGECAREQQFVSSAFRAKIDLQAHKALKHSKNKTKAEAKQARTLDFEFPLAPRSMQNGERSPNSSDFRRNQYKAQMNHQRPQSSEENFRREPAEDVEESQKQHQMKTFNTRAEEFPTLSGEYGEQTDSGSMWLSGATRYRTQQQRRSEDFPALTPVTSGVSQNKARVNNNSQQPKAPKSAWNDPNRLGKLSRPSTAKTQEKSKSSHWSGTKVTNSELDFPRLETKKQFQSEITPVEELEGHPKCWPISLSSQTAEQLGQEIYEKCKSKKKKKKNMTNDLKSRVGCIDQDKPIISSDLSNIYSGISDRNTNGNEENQDPLQAAKAKCMAYERPKKKVVDDVDEVPWCEKPNFIADDFPPLEVTESSVKGPPGFGAAVISSLPPPGFSTKLQSRPKLSSSSISLKSVAQQLASEVASSDSETKEIKHSYTPPPCFQERNNLLTNMIYESLDENNESFDKFRILSGSFRKDRTTVQDYHMECVSIFGKEKFHNLFTELICLLPDISKQQELLTVHSKFLKDESKNRGAVPKDISLSEWTISTVSSCPICLQVLKNTDYSDHVQCHKNKANG